MAPAWAQFESKYQDRMRIVTINVDQRETEEFKAHAKWMQRAIPHTVWLSRKGALLQQQAGSMSLEQLGQISDTVLAQTE